MSAGFYKLDDQLLFAPTQVDGPGFTLLAAEHETYTYPVHGWRWFDSIEEAIAGSKFVPLEPVVNGVPQEVTMRQARLALLGAGLLSFIEGAIDAMAEPTKSAARIEWEYSGAVQRHNGFVSALAPALGLTEQQIDQLFITASSL